MKIRLFLAAALLSPLTQGARAQEPAKITYDDHIKPILREHCTSCHNSNDKKSGLALDSYQGVMTGGSGGEVVVEGDLDSSRLYALTAHKEQPFMPPNQDMIAQAKVDLMKTWIEQGMPENSGSAIKKPKASSMALKVTMGRPEGAPPMPKTMLKQTPFATTRAATTSAIASSPWAPLVAVGGQMQVSLYHSESGQLLGILPFPEGEPQSITFSRDGKLVLVGGGKHSHSGYAALYDIESGNRIARVGDELDIVMSADINDNNELIALAGPQKLVRVYSTLTGELKYEQKKHTDWIYSVKFSPDGLLLASADRSAGLVVWEAGTGRLYLDLQGHKGEIRSVAWRPDSAALISSSMDGTLKMWEMNEGKVIKSWDAHPGGALAVDVCNDGTMVSTGRDNKVKVWDINGNGAGEMPPLVEAGHEVTITVDGKQVAAGDWAGNVRLWQRANPKDERNIPANPLPLDQMLAKVQSELELWTPKQQVLNQDYVAKSSQQSALQKQLEEIQTQLAAVDQELNATNAKQTELKPNFETLSAQHKSKLDELNAIRGFVVPKQKILEVASSNIKSWEAEIAELTQKKGAAGAEAAELDSKIANLQNQNAIQVAAITQIQAELAPKLPELQQKEKEFAELNAKFEPVNQEWIAIAAKQKESSDKKAALEPQVEPKKAALAAAIEATNQSKVQLDAANASMAAIQSSIAQLQSDIQAFQSRSAELAKKKADLEQALSSVASQVEPAEKAVAEAKSQVDATAAEIAKLQAQLVDLQKKMAEEQAKKDAMAGDMSAKQQAAEKLKEQASQLESDAAASAVQIDLFEQAYGKKP